MVDIERRKPFYIETDSGRHAHTRPESQGSTYEKVPRYSIQLFWMSVNNIIQKKGEYTKWKQF